MESQPHITQWRILYQLAVEIRELEPWSFMEEQDMCAIQDPQSHEWYYIQVTGCLGEHLAVCAYKGIEGLKGLYRIVKNLGHPDLQTMIETPQIMLSFEDRNYLDPFDREMAKQMDLKCLGGQTWPMFRAYHPGFLPWFLNAPEAGAFIPILQQFLLVSRRFREQSFVLNRGGAEFFARVPVMEGTALTWHDSSIKPDFNVMTTCVFVIDHDKSEWLRDAPKGGTLEADIFLSPNAVSEKHERPYYPYLLLVIDTESELVLGHHLFDPKPDLPSMWEKVPVKFVDLLIGQHVAPARVHVRSGMLYDLLLPIAKQCKFSLKLTDDLENIDNARKSMREFFSGKFD